MYFQPGNCQTKLFTIVCKEHLPLRGREVEDDRIFLLLSRIQMNQMQGKASVQSDYTNLIPHRNGKAGLLFVDTCPRTVDLGPWCHLLVCAGELKMISGLLAATWM